MAWTRWLTIGPLVAGLVIAAPLVSAQTVPDRPQQTKPATEMNEDLQDAAEQVQQSIEVLNELTRTPDDRIPQHLLNRAEAIVVIPALIKGGFIVGAKHGKGIVSVRNATTQAWSAPAFVKMTGGSIGWQIGAQSVDLVLLVMNKGGVEELLEDKFTIGGSASVAAGPVGRSADAGTDAQLSAQILAYSRAKGLFAGATLEGAAIHADDDNNAATYGEDASLKTITMGAPAMNVPAFVNTWKQTIARVTAAK